MQPYTLENSVSVLLALNKTIVSILHLMQEEECFGNPLQSATLPTHCAKPDDIVTMHHSPVHGLSN